MRISAGRRFLILAEVQLRTNHSNTNTPVVFTLSI